MRGPFIIPLTTHTLPYLQLELSNSHSQHALTFTHLHTIISPHTCRVASAETVPRQSLTPSH